MMIHTPYQLVAVMHQFVCHPPINIREEETRRRDWKPPPLPHIQRVCLRVSKYFEQQLTPLKPRRRFPPLSHGCTTLDSGKRGSRLRASGPGVCTLTHSAEVVRWDTKLEKFRDVTSTYHALARVAFVLFEYSCYSLALYTSMPPPRRPPDVFTNES